MGSFPAQSWRPVVWGWLGLRVTPPPPPPHGKDSPGSQPLASLGLQLCPSLTVPRSAPSPGHRHRGPGRPPDSAPWALVPSALPWGQGHTTAHSRYQASRMWSGQAGDGPGSGSCWRPSLGLSASPCRQRAAPPGFGVSSVAGPASQGSWALSLGCPGLGLGPWCRLGADPAALPGLLLVPRSRRCGGR